MILRSLYGLLLVAGLVFCSTFAVEADQTDPRLDDLFEKLSATQSPARARQIEGRIWSIWVEPPPGAGVAEAMQRGLRSMALGQSFDAMRAFDTVVERAPDFAEGWNKRATVRYALGDLAGSLQDIRRTLALEPRHFGALSGLGLVRLAQDKPAEALAAFEAALKIHPNLPGLEEIEALREQVHGKPL